MMHGWASSTYRRTARQQTGAHAAPTAHAGLVATCTWRTRHGPGYVYVLEASAALLLCTACSFWDTGLNATPPWRRVEVASDGAPPD